MKYREWDLYWAIVPFRGYEEEKVRPVIIKDDGTVYVVAWYVTSQSPKPGIPCYNIKQWDRAGLSKPSNVHLDYPIRLDVCSIKERIGRLSDMDIALMGMELAKLANRR